MITKNIHKNLNGSRHILLFVALMNILYITGCCSKYNYYMYTDSAENFLKEKKYDKAEKLISYAYNEEKKSKDKKIERITWLYYRLGVISEQKNNLARAKGYYWGDSINEGFYDSEPKTAWLAKLGWTHLDNNSTPRPLDKILEYETMDPPTTTIKKVEKKKVKRKNKKAAYVPKQRFLDLKHPTLSPPEPTDEGIFDVWR